MATKLAAFDQGVDDILTVPFSPEELVDRHIRNLRVKLQNGWRHPRYIATIAGRGYRFVPTVAEDPAAVQTAP